MSDEEPRWRQDFPIGWDNDHYVTRRELAKFLTLGSALLALATGVVARVARRVAVMYLGAIVEEGPADAVVARPLHPYTAALVAAAAGRTGERAPGASPASAPDPPGCPYRLRCPVARPRCRTDLPALEAAESGRSVACFFPGEANDMKGFSETFHRPHA